MKKIFTVQDKYNEYNVGYSFSESIAKEIAAEADKRYPYGAPHIIIDNDVYESLDEYIEKADQEEEKSRKDAIVSSWGKYPLYRVTVKDSFSPGYYFSYIVRSLQWPKTPELDLIGISASEYSGKGKHQEMIKRYIIDSVEFLAPPGVFHDDYNVEHFIKNIENKVE